MYPTVCPVCKSTIYEVKEQNVENNIVFHSSCERNRKKKKIKERPFRTSTPVAEFDDNETTSFSDSVNEFFYQSWKSGLHSDDTIKSQPQFNGFFNQPCQPTYYPTQIIYVNTVVYQPVFPVLRPYTQVGYRPDGTFGLLPGYWPYGVS